MHINRLKYKEILDQKLTYSPAVAILGARQVGKTTLALNYAQSSGRQFIYLDLENLDDLAKIENNYATFFDFYKDYLVVIDEIQTKPDLFNSLRGIIDKHRQAGRFILLGSASPLLVKGVSETLAGRISYFDLSTFNLSEIKPAFDLQSHWLKGGFPNAFLAENIDIAQAWISDFVRSYVERDLNVLFDKNFNAVLARRLWTMLAHQQGDLLNSNTLSRSLGVTAPVVNRYIEYMEGAFLLHRLQPWHSNTKKRLIKSPKIYLKDTGILHFFQRIKSYEELLTHPIIGASWESYVVEQLLYHKPQEIDMYFYRTHNQAEIDVLLVKNEKPEMAIEIKLNNSPKISRGFYNSCEDLGIERKYVITPSAATFPKPNNVLVMSLENFISNILGP